MLICEALRKCLWRARLERETADRRAVIPLRQWRPASIYTRARSLENFSSPSKLYNVRELLTLEKKRPFVCNKRTWSSLSRKLWLARWFSLLENVEFSSQLFFLMIFPILRWLKLFLVDRRLLFFDFVVTVTSSFIRWKIISGWIPSLEL